MLDPAEYPLLHAVVANLADDSLKLVYADWLEDRGDRRCEFLRSLVSAARTMREHDFPSADGLDDEWLDLIGYRLLQRVVQSTHPKLQLKELVLRLARPALRIMAAAGSRFRGVDGSALGASKRGGLPDVPPDFVWPRAEDCPADFASHDNEDPSRHRLAGFVGQINLAEIAHTCAARALPKSGWLSFFCHEGARVRAKVMHFSDAQPLVRMEPDRNYLVDRLPANQWRFVETLDLPGDDGPWASEIRPLADAYHRVYVNTLGMNWDNVLGYSRSAVGRDPTPSQDSRHLTTINTGRGELYLQIPQADLTAHNFDAITIPWYSSTAW